MARKTIRDKLRTLKRRFPNQTDYQFFYLNKGDLKRKYEEIVTYFLIYDPERGHSVFACEPHRKLNVTPLQWNAWLNSYFLSVVVHDIMEAINSKRGAHWEAQRFIGFHGGGSSTMHKVGERESALYRDKNRNKRKKRNKTNDKRK